MTMNCRYFCAPPKQMIDAAEGRDIANCSLFVPIEIRPEIGTLRAA
jgi:hypothetical protein